MNAPELFTLTSSGEVPAVDITGMVREPDRRGSIEAALGRVRNIKDVARDRDVVLHLLYEAGERGLTDYCLAHKMSTPDNPRKQTSIGKRRGELVRDGFVAERLVVDPKSLALVQELRVPIAGSTSRCGVWCLAHYSKPDGPPRVVSAPTCGGPERCWDDLCVHSDRGICGIWRNLDDLGDDEDYFDDEDER